MLTLFTVPVLAVAALAIYWIIAIPGSTSHQSSDSNAPYTPLAVALQFGLVLLLLSAIGGSALAIISAIGRSELSERILRFALWSAGVVSIVITVGPLAAVALTTLIVGEAPQVSSSPSLHAGELLMMLVVVWLVVVWLAAFALKRGIQAARNGEGPV